ncbi:TPA: hypothetical protein NGU92_004434, partial [Vibrio parahaemolyticus]|nr:hypothetical protein [Vibrio parahaemolyticus]
MKRMLSAPEIYLYRESVDFRKSINGLAAIIESDTDLPLGKWRSVLVHQQTARQNQSVVLG